MGDAGDESADEELLSSRVPLQRLSLTLPSAANVANLQFVLRSTDGSMWYRDGAQNFAVPVPGASQDEDDAASRVTDPITMAIIDAENTNAWTLMHRFNRAADLLGDVLGGQFEDANHATAALCVAGLGWVGTQSDVKHACAAALVPRTQSAFAARQLRVACHACLHHLEQLTAPLHPVSRSHAALAS